jgi:RHS repeat-associated protein
VVEQLGTYPFGEGWYNATNEKWLFTTYERDAESLNDYALAWSYVNRLGRFSSPDPLAGDPNNPQSLNRYSYVSNDPIDLVDPSGLGPTDPVSQPIQITVWAPYPSDPFIGFMINPLSVNLAYFTLESPPIIRRPPLLPTFTVEAYDDCAKKAFGGTRGSVPGSDKSIPGYEASLDVLQASLLTGADAATVGITMAYESNSDLQAPTNLNANGSVDIGPMQLNTDTANNGGFPHIFPGALTDPQGNFPLPNKPFTGNALSNIMTGALYLRSLGDNPQNYAAPVYRAARAQVLQDLDAAFRSFFNCLTVAATPQ